MPGPKDDDILSEQVLGQIDSVMELLDNLPSIEECQSLCEIFQQDSAASEIYVAFIPWSTTRKQHLGSKHRNIGRSGEAK
eukprot:scaffold9547_cov53-Attheya_sp.AAC.4